VDLEKDEVTGTSGCEELLKFVSVYVRKDARDDK
jgi:hypothetical protein